MTHGARSALARARGYVTVVCCRMSSVPAHYQGRQVLRGSDGHSPGSERVSRARAEAVVRVCWPRVVADLHARLETPMLVSPRAHNDAQPEACVEGWCFSRVRRALGGLMGRPMRDTAG